MTRDEKATLAAYNQAVVVPDRCAHGRSGGIEVIALCHIGKYGYYWVDTVACEFDVPLAVQLEVLDALAALPDPFYDTWGE